MDDQFTFDNSSSMYSFFEDLDGEDSGMEDLPFSNYVELEGIIERAEVDKDNCKEILGTGTVFDKDEDELTFIDDDKDEDYKPRKARSISKKGNAKPTKRRHYPNTCFSMNKVLLLTPEKQIISQCDTDSNSSMRHYARKDRTPNTIKKMMERHRESERVRHHSLNESLKDVCMRVPGYDPGAKETKVIQMQRIIGYECFLENTFRHLCDQLGVPAKLVLKMNTQFISDALNNTPIEDFYQPSSYKTSDGDDEEDLEEDDRILTVQSRENDTPIGCRLIRSSNAEDNLLQYPREKISSPTVDSTTDNNIRLTPLPNVLPEIGSPTPRYITKYDYHSQWKPQTGFKPVGSSQGMHSSQESGIKIETQSSLEDDYHFHEMNSLIEESLYDSEQLRTVTPSFMREETVTTSTGVEESDEGFDLSSPIRNRESVFLHSPPLRGIWHSANKYHLLNKVDTPKRKEMETVSPENTLETKPKDSRIKTAAPGSTGFHSTIRPMTEILSSKEKQIDNANISKILDVEKSSDNCLTRVSANNHTYLRSSDKAGAINNVEDRLHLKGLSGGPNPSVPSTVGQIIKTTQMKNVKVRIIHASPSQRNQQNKLTSLTSVSSTSAALPFTSVSSKGPEVVHMTPSLFSQTQQFITKKENYSTILDNQHGITQLKRIPVPVVTALHELPVPVGSPLHCGVGFGFPLQCGVGFGSPELKNKRKRYTPYRSPFLDRTNQESDDESWTIENKKRKLEEKESVPSTV